SRANGSRAYKSRIHIPPRPERAAKPNVGINGKTRCRVTNLEARATDCLFSAWRVAGGGPPLENEAAAWPLPGHADHFRCAEAPEIRRQRDFKGRLAPLADCPVIP